MTDDRSKYGTDHTSVKVRHAPGGQSNFSLGWGEEEKKTPTEEEAARKKKREEEEAKKKEEEEKAKRDVAERPAAGASRPGPGGRYGGQPPGGKSSIQFG